MSNPIETRSKEFNKPKVKNLRKNKNGDVIDIRQPRDEQLIKECHKQINSSK